nr:uncharacterized protein LOC128780362 [Desmodus rotundus]
MKPPPRDAPASSCDPRWDSHTVNDLTNHTRNSDSTAGISDTLFISTSSPELKNTPTPSRTALRSGGPPHPQRPWFPEWTRRLGAPPPDDIIKSCVTFVATWEPILQMRKQAQKEEAGCFKSYSRSMARLDTQQASTSDFTPSEPFPESHMLESMPPPPCPGGGADPGCPGLPTACRPPGLLLCSPCQAVTSSRETWNPSGAGSTSSSPGELSLRT